MVPNNIILDLATLVVCFIVLGFAAEYLSRKGYKTSAGVLGLVIILVFIAIVFYFFILLTKIWQANF